MVPILKGTGIGSFFPLNLILEHLKSDYTLVQGHHMYLDAHDTLGLSLNGTYEELETALVTKEVKKGDIVVDIGANIGYYTLLFARLVGDEGKVYAFEPDPASFALLKKNVEKNGYKNVVLVKKAVSDKTGTIKLYICEENKGDHRIYNSGDKRKYVEIKSTRLDDYFGEIHENINFIKMDIQGSEGLALKGMADILKRNANLKIILEFWPIGLKRSGTSAAAVLEFLLNERFSLSELDENTKRLSPVTMNALLKKYKDQSEEYTSLYCSKRVGH